MMGGESFYDFPLKLVARKNVKHEKLSRLGIAVSKKYSKSAVKRNYAKRLIRECFRNSDLREIGLDILVILSKSINVKTKKETGNSINRKFKNLEGRILWAQTKKER